MLVGRPPLGSGGGPRRLLPCAPHAVLVEGPLDAIAVSLVGRDAFAALAPLSPTNEPTSVAATAG